MTNDTKATLRDVTREYHHAQTPAPPFIPGVTPLFSSGLVLGEEDRGSPAEASPDPRIVTASPTRQFERLFAHTLGVRKARLVNSGPAANLLAVSALTSPQLTRRRLRPGDEVITVAAGFPMTVNPIIQNGLVPVFIDVELGTYNATPHAIEAAITPRTRAIALAHTLGNPYAASEVVEIAKRHDLWLIEDNCDAFGSTYRGQLTGTFGDLSTASFYPAHHISMCEGGCVATNDLHLARIVEAVRDWRPDNIGYHLKATDQQAALGVRRLTELPRFMEVRRRNWRRLREALIDVPGLLLPMATEHSDPSWFGFVLTVLPDTPFSRGELVAFLESRKIGTRQLFAGNFARHPAYRGLNYRTVGDLRNTDLITEHSFWIGVHPGLTDEMIDYMASAVREFIWSHSHRWQP